MTRTEVLPETAPGKILLCLLRNERSYSSELASMLGMKTQSVASHLAVMKQEGLVSSEDDSRGKFKYWSLTDYTRTNVLPSLLPPERFAAPAPTSPAPTASTLNPVFTLTVAGSSPKAERRFVDQLMARLSNVVEHDDRSLITLGNPLWTDIAVAVESEEVLDALEDLGMPHVEEQDMMDAISWLISALKEARRK